MHIASLPALSSAQRLVAALAVAVVVTVAIVVSVVRLAGGTDTRAPSTSRLVPAQSYQVCRWHQPC
jgi:hypothetical protein